MAIETLNRIKSFTEKPTAGELAELMSGFISDVEEEYFWISASNQNRSIIYHLLRDYDTKYFIHKLGVIADENKYSQLHFRMFRFLIDVAKRTDKTDSLFEHLNSVILYLIDLLIRNTPKINQQILFFVSELILELPLKFFKGEHISFLSLFSLSGSTSYIGADIVNHFVPRIIEEKNHELLEVVLDKLIFNLNPEDYKDDLYRTNYDGYNASTLLNEETINLFIKLIGHEKLLEFTLGKISAMVEKAPYNFSHLGISTIEDSSQILDKNRYEFVLVKFLRMQLDQERVSSKTIEHLISLDKGIFRRIAIYSISQNYEILRDNLWKIVTPDFLIDTEIKHEFFVLLKKNANIINSTELEKLLVALNGMIEVVVNDSLSKKEILEYNSLLAKEYLLALDRISSDLKSLVADKIKELEEVAPWKIDNPGYNMYIDRSVAVPKNREEFSETFNTKDLPEFFDIAEKGFIGLNDRDALKIVNRINYLLRDNIPFILQNQERLIKIGFENFYEIPNFFEKAWLDKLNIDWAEVFLFFGRVIDTNYSKNPEAYQHFISYCAWLIRSTTRDDKHALSGKALEEAKNLCLKFLALNIQSERLNKDPFFDILNSTDGKIYDATLEVLLRNARLNKTDNIDRWYPDVKMFYSDLLQSTRQTDATIWSLSMHLTQFGYLDMEWLKENINHIFVTGNRELWILAMRGYHKYCSQVYKVIFDLLLNNGHYELALEIFKDEQVDTDEVFEHIVMAYVAGWEGSELDNPKSIIYKTLQIGNRSQIHGLIHFFLKNKHFPQGKMLAIWRAILDSKAVNDPLVYNDLLLLFTNLTQLDSQAFELVSLTLERTTTSQVLHRMIHTLFEMEDGDPIFKAKILMQITEPNFEVFYDRDRGFEKLAVQVIKTDPVFGKQFVSQMIDKRLFNLLDIYNKI